MNETKKTRSRTLLHGNNESEPLAAARLGALIVCSVEMLKESYRLLRTGKIAHAVRRARASSRALFGLKAQAMPAQGNALGNIAPEP